MRPKTVVVLAILVAGLAAFIAFVERDLPSSDELQESAKKVLAVDGSEIERLEIESPAGRVVLSRTAGVDAEGEVESGRADVGWQLEAPALGDASRTLVDELLRDLTGLEKVRSLENAEPTAVGLDTPRGRVAVTLPERTIALAVGAEIPASSTMIVAVEGDDEPLVVDAGVWESLSRPAGEWRSRELFAADRSSIRSLRLDRSDAESLVLERDEGGSAGDFRLVEPLADTADRDHASALLSALTSLQIATFIDDSPAVADLGLDEPWAVLEVRIDGTDETFRLTFGSLTETADERYYRRSDGQLFRASKSLDESVTRRAAEWRSRRWTELESYDIERLDVADAAGGETLVEKVDGDWQRDGEEIPYAAASDFLYALTGARAEGFVDREVAAGTAAEMTIELAAGDRSETVELVSNAGGWLGRSSARPVDLQLPSSAAEELQQKLEALRVAEPVEHEVGETASSDSSPLDE